MKKILVAALLFAAPALAMAQQKPGKSREDRQPLSAGQRAERQTERLDKMVQLTPEQREKISAENRRAVEAMKPHMDNIRRERMAMREIAQQRREAYANILTAEQKERLKAARMEQRKAREAGDERPMRRGRMNMQRSPEPKQ